MEKITGGLSNEVFKYKDLIFKFYNYSLLELDYSFEEFVQKKLHEKFANVPEICQSICIDNKLIGRVEKFIKSTTVSKEHFISEFKIYANILNNIHSTNIDDYKEKVPKFLLYLNNWTQILDNQINVTKLNFPQLKLDHNKIKEKADEYITSLLLYTSYMQLEMKLCHNDFQQLNVLVDSTNKFYVIDFEYASLNYIYYDIANYFAECALDNTELRYYPHLYPNKEKRCQFYKEYFNNLYPNNYYEQFDNLVLNFCPLVEYTWYVWAMIKLISTNSIDYLTYAKIRYKNFFESLGKLNISI
jgi:thiamine kinase-like enzyme